MSTSLSVRCRPEAWEPKRYTAATFLLFSKKPWAFCGQVGIGPLLLPAVAALAEIDGFLGVGTTGPAGAGAGTGTGRRAHAAGLGAVGDDHVQKPVDDGNDDGAEYGGPEAHHVESRDDAGGHFEQKRVDDKGEKPQGHYVERQREHQQDGLEKHVQKPDGGRGEKGCEKAGHVNVFDQIGCCKDGYGQNQPFDQEQSGKGYMRGPVSLVVKAPVYESEFMVQCLPR